MKLHHAVLLSLTFAFACTSGGGHPTADPDPMDPAVDDAGTPPADEDAGPSSAPDAGAPSEADAGASCEPTDGQCYSDDECCTGFCTWAGSVYAYAPGYCVQPQETGSYCIADNWCASGHCREELCVNAGPDECLAENDPCDPGASACCAGTSCFEEYIMGRCLPLREVGEYCRDNADCASSRCELSTCRAAACMGPQGECYWDGECCSGFCSYTGTDYAPGACTSQLAAGAYCLDHRWCESWQCSDEQCL